MNEVALAKIANLALAGLTFYAELQRGLDILRRAQAEGRDVTPDELDMIKSAEQVAADREADAIRNAGSQPPG
jgi:hypothetical protein